MMEHQNYLLEIQVSVAVSGFEDIELPVPDPENVPMDGKEDPSMEGVDPPTVSLIQWILRKKAPDGNKLITSIEKGPRGVHFFYTAKHQKEEMIEYIDGLETSIRTQFGYKTYCNATDGNTITRKFCKKIAKNTGEASQVFTQLLTHSPATGKKYNNVDNCWKCKPKLDYLALDDEKAAKANKNKREKEAKKEKEEDVDDFLIEEESLTSERD
eukprot:13224585-Ditylum_brightwellii.AAC.1